MSGTAAKVAARGWLSDLVPTVPWSAPRAAIARSSGDVIGYVELDEASARAERALRGLGASDRRAVAVAVASPAGFVIAALGAWCAGAVLVPIHARVPREAAVTLARRAGCTALVVDAQSDGTLSLAAEIDPDTGREHDARAALVLCTSGSSAEPKLVLLSAEGIAANVSAILRYLPIQRAPRTAVVVALSYSYGLVGQVLTTLAAGGTLLLLGDLPLAAEQLSAMRTLGAEGLSTVPSSIRHLSRAAIDLGSPLPLSYVASAGAALGPETVDLARRAFPGATLFNQYGLTEASPRVTALADTEPAFARGSVGRALEGLEVFAVDEHGARLRAGAHGELAVRGASVMLCYLDDPASTARALSPDGVLRTGDRGWVDEEGWVHVLGRSDGVVKVSGERVSLEEVASALRSAAGVRDAAVVAIPHAELGARLVAFVEGDPEATKQARAVALRTLPPAKRPFQIIRLDALPRTETGKIALAELSRRAAPVAWTTREDAAGDAPKEEDA